MKYQNVDSKIMYKWYLLKGLLTAIVLAGLVLSIVIIPGELIIPKVISIVFLGVTLLFTLFALFITKIQYAKYRYIITSEEITISKGFIFKSYFVIPFIQIQDVGYFEGPIDLILKIANVKLSTAGSNHVIVGLKKETAISIVNQLKENVKEILNNKPEINDEV